MNRQIQKGSESNLEAQRLLVNEIASSNDKVKDTSILPRWYLDGWMYSAIFVVSLFFVGIIFLLMMNHEDIDANFDGIPDHQQIPRQQTWNRPQMPREAVRIHSRTPLTRTTTPVEQSPAQFQATDARRTIGSGNHRMIGRGENIVDEEFDHAYMKNRRSH